MNDRGPIIDCRDCGWSLDGCERCDGPMDVVPRSVADNLADELGRARKTLWKAGFTTCADSAGYALAEYRAAYQREETP